MTSRILTIAFLLTARLIAVDLPITVELGAGNSATVTAIYPDDGPTGSLTYDTDVSPARGARFVSSQNGLQIAEITEEAVVAAILSPEPSTPLEQTLEVVLSRLTDTEFTALTTSTDIRVQRFVKIAEIRGRIRADNPDLQSAATLLDGLNIIAADRWVTLLAP